MRRFTSEGERMWSWWGWLLTLCADSWCSCAPTFAALCVELRFEEITFGRKVYWSALSLRWWEHRCGSVVLARHLPLRLKQQLLITTSVKFDLIHRYKPKQASDNACELATCRTNRAFMEIPYLVQTCRQTVEDIKIDVTGSMQFILQKLKNFTPHAPQATQNRLTSNRLHILVASVLSYLILKRPLNKQYPQQSKNDTLTHTYCCLVCILSSQIGLDQACRKIKIQKC